MHLVPGTRLGRYDIRSLLGAGGMGEVYLAHDTSLRRDVAIKVLPNDAARDRERLRRFEQEAQAVSSLNHPNILTIYEIGVHDDTLFVATELVEGESLRDRMARERLDAREVLDIGVQIASALAAAHATGIIHRDIKPENIMVRKDGIVKVLDFGLAKLVARGTTEDAASATKTTADTLPGVVLGTVHYMSPEQARGLQADPRTDIWSLGVVLYELLAGRSTFEGTTSSDLIAAILRTDPPPLTTHVRNAPPELERIVTKALQKDREERYQDAKDLAIDLKSLKRRLDIDAELARHSGERVDPKIPPRVSSVRRRSAILITVAAAAIALAFAAYRGFFGRIGGGNIDSVAVLPFTNESGNPDNDYLSDGISDTLINSLSQLSGVKVIARSSSFTYKRKVVDPVEVAQTLGVRAIVTGRVLQRGDNLLIGVELVDTTDRTQLWGEHYNRKVTDLLQVQADISAEIAERLQRRLTAGERDRLTKPETANQQAFEELMKSRTYFSRGGTQNLKRAIEHAQKAIAIDPNYALAYTYVANATRVLVVDGVLDPKEFIPKAEALVQKALELDDTLGDAHHVLANLKREAWDWAGAEREYQRAMALHPNFAMAHYAYASFLSNMGRHDQAIAEATRARELDPASSGASIARRLFFARRYDEAIELLKQPGVPERVSTYVTFGYAYAAKGMHNNAIAAYQQAIKLGDESPSLQIYLGASYAAGGQREPAQAILKQLETSKAYVSPGELAILYAALGQREEAFRSLEKGFAAHDPQLQFLAVDPAFDSLRSDPRFADLLRRVGLPVDATTVRH
jgi:serine/threonine protein kinase/Flp pilus assembly protein TadD